MRKVINDLLQSVFSNNSQLEGFYDTHGENIQDARDYDFNTKTNPLKFITQKNPFPILISFIIIELLVLCFGKWLWNNIAVQLIPVLKPAKTIWQILGISILFKLLSNS